MFSAYMHYAKYFICYFIPTLQPLLHGYFRQLENEMK